MEIPKIEFKSSVFTSLDTDSWREALGALKNSGLDDIYFYPEYSRLYQNDQTEMAGFFYREGENLFFINFLKYPVSRELTHLTLFDIESPYGYAGPLSNTQDRNFLRRAWLEFDNYCRESKIIAAFIRFHPLFKNHTVAEAGENRKIIFSNQIVTMSLDKSLEDIWKNYAENTRNKIRKAKKKGVIVVSGCQQEYLKLFEKLYYETMDRLGAEKFFYFGGEYFNCLSKNLKDRFKVYLARVDDICIGASLILYSDNFAHYHLSANVKEYRAFEPASLLRHAVIEDCLKAGLKYIAFGGGRSGKPDDPLFQFKAGFSKERADFYIGKFIFDYEAYSNVCDSWRKLYPAKEAKYKDYLLKYKF